MQLDKSPIIPLHAIVGAIELHMLDAAEGFVPVASEGPLDAALVAIRIEGDAMRAASGGVSFPGGTIGVFSPDAPVTPGDFCLALVQGEPLPVFRRYTEEALGVIRLEPLNPTHRTYWIKDGMPGKILARLVFSVLKH